MGMWWGPGSVWMGLFMLLFWVGVILLIVWAVRGLAGPSAPQGGAQDDRALAILEERFARGEIDLDEFRRRRDALLEGRR